MRFKYLINLLLLTLWSCSPTESTNNQTADKSPTAGEYENQEIVSDEAGDQKNMAAQDHYPPEEEAEPTLPPANVGSYFTLKPLEIKDTELLYEGQSDGPSVTYEISTLLVNTPSDGFNRLVNDSLLSIFSAKMVRSGDHKTAYTSLIQDAFDTYLDEAAADEYFDYNYSYSISVQPRLNDAGILTLDAMEYSYRGGAHGNGYSTYASFADQPARYLGFDQIFIDEADSLRIGVLLTEFIQEEQKEYLFDPDARIPMTKNVGLIKEGVAFHYPQYEIAPYAAGPIEIVLPYDILIYRKLLRPDVEKLVRQLLE